MSRRLSRMRYRRNKLKKAPPRAADRRRVRADRVARARGRNSCESMVDPQRDTVKGQVFLSRLHCTAVFCTAEFLEEE